MRKKTKRAGLECNEEGIMKKASEYLNIPDGKRIWFQDFQPHFNLLVLNPIKRFPFQINDMLIGLSSCPAASTISPDSGGAKTGR